MLSLTVCPMAEFKDNDTNGGTNVTTNGLRPLMWDISCNGSYVDYSNDMTAARCISNDNGYRHIRGPFWESGRHIINIRINTRSSSGMGIGIIDKSFKVSDSKHHIGQTNHSSSYWAYNGEIYSNNKTLKKGLTALKAGDIMTVDIDLYKRTLNLAVNGDYVTVNKDTVTDIPKQVALGATFYHENDTLQIVPYYKM